MTSMLQNEGLNMGAGTNYDDQSNQFGAQYPPGSEGEEQYQLDQEAEMYEQQQMQLAMLEDQMSGPQAVRYDDVYYPRTDKRAIKGNQYTYQGNKHFKASTKQDAVGECINATILNQEVGKSPIEYTNQLSRAKIFDMKGIRVQD